MKHIMIVNPAAGPKNSLVRVKEALAGLSGYDTEIYETKGKGDATVFVRDYCRRHPDERVRFMPAGVTVRSARLRAVPTVLRMHPFPAIPAAAVTTL